MERQLLITLTFDGTSRTYPYDIAARASLTLGVPAGTGTVAIGHVEPDGEGAALLPEASCALYNAAGDEVGACALTGLEGTVLSIVSPKLDQAVSLYIRPSEPGGRRFAKLGFVHDVEVPIGRAVERGFLYANPFVSSTHARLVLTGDRFAITDLGSANGTYVNGRRIEAHRACELAAGDVVAILDLTFVVGARLISINGPAGFSVVGLDACRAVSHAAFSAACPPATEDVAERTLFYPAPRLTRTYKPETFQVDGPPQSKQREDEPAIMQMGPSFLMGIASIFMVSSAVSRLMGGADVWQTLPMIAMSVSMLAGMLVWPFVSRRYNKRRDQREELRREATYTDYLNGVEARLLAACDEQAAVLRENRMPLDEVLIRARDLSPRLMNRTSVHDDFMDLRVGTGSVELDANIRFPERRFSMDDDKLLDKVTSLAERPPRVHDVPLAFDPVAHFVAGVLGPRAEVWAFTRGLVAQICALFSYQDVKIALVASPEEEAEWGFMRSVPHLFDDAGVSRLLATDTGALMQLGMHLERVLEARREVRAEVMGDYGTYYVVICASKELAERSQTIANLAKQRVNRGISLIYLGSELKDLPRECAHVVDLSRDDALSAFGRRTSDLGAIGEGGQGSACMFDRADVSGSLEAFEPDIELGAAAARRFALDIARVHLDMPEQRTSLPTSLGFLEMCRSGNVAALEIDRRWIENDASRTIEAPIGVDAQGELSYLDLHEKVHGPHGLVAGTTGSGKSEFLITYILSMSMNYPPDQVAFVLIDYKGGGLAGAFDNERVQLPHLAGTITNLDGAAISRSLVSIKSELKRRQDAFNRAREATGEATMDIYKYLSYYRRGVLTEPLPHLIIVADEFAELKQQEPGFMDELVSAARIGRSLGVHLILATQKPSGVVNDQIWSNSRFKVCLKVADVADSKEMIRRSDAAGIKEAGRYYMLVGYNEYFTCGQNAYTGVKYAPSDEFEPKADTAVELIDDMGAQIATLKPASRARATNEAEINVVLAEIARVAAQTGKRAQRLWLDPLPEVLPLDGLEARYRIEHAEGALVSTVGEVDIPARQERRPLAVDIAQAGNVLVYGAQDSGADALVATMLYSLAASYGPRDFNLYVADLGQGVLAPFAELPQCGGVVMQGDLERMVNLFKMLEQEVARRRKLLVPYGGSLDAYRAATGSPLPRIVFALTNLASFYELYAPLEDRLNALARDAVRLGIHCIVTATSAMTPRMRLKANFARVLACFLNDETEYVTVFGHKPQVIPVHVSGRGVVELEKEVLEFQAATPAGEDATIADAVRALAREVEPAPAASAIPELPERVTCAQMPPVLPGEVPVGYSKDAVEPVAFPFAKSPYMLVLGNDADGIGRYLRGMWEAIAADPAAPVAAIDLTGALAPFAADARIATTEEDAGEKVRLITSGAEECSVFILVSVAQIMGKLAADDAKRLQDYIIGERAQGHTGLVATSELWRVRQAYDPWYKALSAYGNGVWIGNGMSDQTVFRMAQASAEYRKPLPRSEGFLILRGAIDGVRFTEWTDEPQEDVDS
ncbi:type VII secretion protein EssC [Enorma burkinafasonensis]|uniref:type VII secretion protein EssC n=1 Tax=Enorma burkinafasonensis TaxID=2590867 RepID=UPI0026F21AA9|nr:type VII secretion protein EssC [Enorma burkinafasonensis]MCI7730992.1 type VII secretion protein EssC [Enorma burkinafasonensis]